jgi:hypothetical protein
VEWWKRETEILGKKRFFREPNTPILLYSTTPSFFIPLVQTFMRRKYNERYKEGRCEKGEEDLPETRGKVGPTAT